MSIKDVFFNFLFPPVCLVCDSFGYFICPKCQQKMSKLDGFICPSCLMNCPSGELHPRCKGNIDGLISCWNYEKTTQKIIKEIKYRFYYSSIKHLIKFYLQQRQKSPAFEIFIKKKPLLIPVPLHPKRLKYRGFNQADLIVKELAKAWNLDLSNKILFRTKFSKPQAELSKKERFDNTKNMFAANPKLLKIGDKPLKDKNIILVDDVWTTGSTAQACAGVLKKLGAEQIWTVTLTR